MPLQPGASPTALPKRRAVGQLSRRALCRHHCRDHTPVARTEPHLTYLLKLYVLGRTAKAERAISNLREICEQQLGGAYELQIIDVRENPQIAEDEKILATPTLIKQLPPPLRRVIGDLSDKDKVLLGLEVHPDVPPSNA